MTVENSIERYGKVKCGVCGESWATHPPDSTCSRYRPTEVPAWVLAGAKQIDFDADGKRRAYDLGGSGGAAPTTDDAAKARRELAGGASGEWAAVNGEPANGKNGPVSHRPDFDGSTGAETPRSRPGSKPGRLPGNPPAPLTAENRPSPVGRLAERWQDRLVFDRNVSATSPVICGTWVTAAQVVSLIVDGWTWSSILRTHPELCEDDIRTCLAYVVAEEDGRLNS